MTMSTPPKPQGLGRSSGIDRPVCGRSRCPAGASKGTPKGGTFGPGTAIRQGKPLTLATRGTVHRRPHRLPPPAGPAHPSGTEGTDMESIPVLSLAALAA
jgi:hypothetical protein